MNFHFLKKDIYLVVKVLIVIALATILAVIIAQEYSKNIASTTNDQPQSKIDGFQYPYYPHPYKNIGFSKEDIQELERIRQRTTPITKEEMLETLEEFSLMPLKDKEPLEDSKKS